MSGIIRRNILRFFTSTSCIFALCCIFAFLSAVLRVPKVDQYVFYDADATYHVLLTMKAYDETPVSVHKFLPIVTLGHKDDKHIPWGSTIPDRYGNYYYTSFSAAGFSAPYFFVKLFHLPINEKSLYLFNSLLYFFCFLLTARLFTKLFAEELGEKWIILLVALIYLFQQEIMHSQGIVYWHHSLFQLLILLQFNLFLDINKKRNLSFFFLLCLIVPYVEWTGYVSNAGFALIFLWQGFLAYQKKSEIRTSLVSFLVVMLLTGASSLLFFGHYLTVLSANDFIDSLSQRFFMRNSESASQLHYLPGNYFLSYKYLLIITICTIVFAAFFSFSEKYQKSSWPLLKKHSQILFLFCFIMLENVVMSQHANQYSFDRIKALFPLIFIIIFCVATFESTPVKSFLKNSIVFACFLMAIVNLLSYTNQSDGHFFTDVDYLHENRQIAETVNSRYPLENSVLSHAFVNTRGYSNFLFGRGIYENRDFSEMIETAKSKNKRYIVFFQCPPQDWNMYDYRKYAVYDTDEERFIYGELLSASEQTR